MTAWREAFLDALADDFNTPRALAALFELIAEGNRRTLPGCAGRAGGDAAAARAGVAARRPAETADPEAERLLAEREEARAARDFERADRLRDELAERGLRGPRHARGARG